MIHEVFNDGEPAPMAGPVLAPLPMVQLIEHSQLAVDQLIGVRPAWKPCCGFLPQAGKAKLLTCSIGPSHPFLKLA
jgi:hypothetical protein